MKEFSRFSKKNLQKTKNEQKSVRFSKKWKNKEKNAQKTL